MRKIKIFVSPSYSRLENEVNEWFQINSDFIVDEPTIQYNTVISQKGNNLNHQLIIFYKV